MSPNLHLLSISPSNVVTSDRLLSSPALVTCCVPGYVKTHIVYLYLQADPSEVCTGVEGTRMCCKNHLELRLLSWQSAAIIAPVGLQVCHHPFPTRSAAANASCFADTGFVLRFEEAAEFHRRRDSSTPQAAGFRHPPPTTGGKIPALFLLCSCVTTENLVSTRSTQRLYWRKKNLISSSAERQRSRSRNEPKTLDVRDQRNTSVPWVLSAYLH